MKLPGMHFLGVAVTALASSGCALFHSPDTPRQTQRLEAPALEKASFSPAAAPRKSPAAARPAFSASPVALVPCAEGSSLSASCGRRTSHEQPATLSGEETARYGVEIDQNQ
ncbi:MAG: hypothetical protein R3C60_01010 [Parvularculaceae bacterium]